MLSAKADLKTALILLVSQGRGPQFDFVKESTGGPSTLSEQSAVPGSLAYHNRRDLERKRYTENETRWLESLSQSVAE